MQDLVPHYFLKRHKNVFSKRIFSLILAVTIFAVVTIFTVLVLAKNKNDKYFSDFKIYVVCTQKSKKKQTLAPNSELIEKLGGSGQIIFYEESYHLVANVYFSKSEAEEIKNNIITSFADTQILEISKKFSKKKIRELSASDETVKFFKVFRPLIEDIQNLSMNFSAGKVSTANVCTKIISEKLEIENMCNSYNKNPKNLPAPIVSQANLISYYLSNFLDNFYQSTKKQSLLADLTLSLALSMCDLFDNL